MKDNDINYWKNRVIYAAIGLENSHLTLLQKQILTNVLCENMSIQETCEVRGLSTKRTRSIFNHGLVKLLESLGKRDFNSRKVIELNEKCVQLENKIAIFQSAV